MRWIFLTLLLLNLGYFSWYNFRGQEQAPPAATRGLRGAASEIVLLEEQQGYSQKRFEAVVANPIVQQPGAEPSGERCGSIGPFPDLFAGWQMVDHLAALEIQAEVKAVDEPTGEHDYRVLMPPLPSLQEAFRKLRELKARKIDSYVITEGPHALGISLGVFSAVEGARSTRQRLERDGYPAQVVEIPRFHREYWVFPATGGEFQLDDAVWRQLAGEGPQVEPRELRCQSGPATREAGQEPRRAAVLDT